MQQTLDKIFEKSVQCTFTNCTKLQEETLTIMIFLLEITEMFTLTILSVNTFSCYAFFSLNE